VLALFAQNNIDTPAVIWGTHFSGGVVSPANPAYTVRELVHHLRDSGARVLVTQRALLGMALRAAGEVGMGRGAVLVLGEGEGERHWGSFLDREGKEGERERLVPGEDLAFLVYSSGTTGLPKGVMLTHLNVVSDMFMVNSAEGELFKWNEDKILAVLPFYHIYGMSHSLEI
jgi:4-coumarate--CoA ligase